MVPNEYGMGDLEALGELDERINGFGGAPGTTGSDRRCSPAVALGREPAVHKVGHSLPAVQADPDQLAQW